MPDYDSLAEILSTFSQKSELEALGLALYSGDSKQVAAIPKLTHFFTSHEIKCVWINNSRLFKFKNPQTGEENILKLEAWSMTEEVEKYIRENSALSVFIAPVYFQKSFAEMQHELVLKHSTKMGRFTMGGTSQSIEADKYFDPVLRKSRIQIQPVCQGGTLESAAKEPMPDSLRIENALALFQKVANFYVELEKARPPILFPDGKPSNFTLDEHNNLAITDLKTFELATETSLQDNSIINLELCPLYIPIPPPRQLSKIYSRHLGINLYCYLSGNSYNSLFSSMYGKNLQQRLSVSSLDLNFSAPIFASENGQLLAALIKSMVHDDQSKRPDPQYVQKALQSIAYMNQLESLLQANPDAALRQFIKDSRMQFISNLLDPIKYATLLSDLEYRLHNNASIRKIMDKLSKLETDLSNSSDQTYNKIIINLKQQVETSIQNKSQFGFLETELECFDLLVHLKSINKSLTYAKIHRFIVDTQTALETLQDQQALSTIKADLEYHIENNQHIHQANSYLIQLQEIEKNKPTIQLTAFIKEYQNQLLTLTTNRQSLRPLLATLEQGVAKYKPADVKTTSSYGRFYKPADVGLDQQGDRILEGDESSEAKEKNNKGILP